MTKKFLPYALALCLFLLTAAALFACDGGEAAETTAAVTEAPTEASATEAPATEVTATEAPATEAPATEAPATEAPATEAPATDAPATEAPETETEGPAPFPVSLPDGYARADIVYDCDDGSILYTYNEKTAEDYAAAVSYYTDGGFDVYSSVDKPGILATTLTQEGGMAHVYFYKNDGELNIVTSDTAAANLPPKTPEVTDGDYVCSVIQLYDNTNVNGMSYIIQLKDGSYIVYDGSYEGQAQKLKKYITNNYKGPGKPIIRAWVLTHSHADHFPTFSLATKRMTNSFIVEHVIYSPLNEDNFQMYPEEQYLSKAIYEEVKGFPGAKLVFAHSGMEFTFCNLKMEFLHTAEDWYKHTTEKGNFNTTSIVSRLYDEAYSALFLADITKIGSDRMVEIYGDYLQSDICQVSHHGVEDVPFSFYDTVKASVLYYPCNLYLYRLPGRNDHVRRWLEAEDYTKRIFIAGAGQYDIEWGTVFAPDEALRIPNYISEYDPTAPHFLLEKDGLEKVGKEGHQVDGVELMTDEKVPYLRLTSAQGDPFVTFFKDYNRVCPPYLVIRYRTNYEGLGQFFVGSGAKPSAKGDTFFHTWNSDGEWHTEIIDLREVGITSITDDFLNYCRLDFFRYQDTKGSYFDIDYVGLFNEPEHVEKFEARRYR